MHLELSPVLKRYVDSAKDSIEFRRDSRSSIISFLRTAAYSTSCLPAAFCKSMFMVRSFSSSPLISRSEITCSNIILSPNGLFVVVGYPSMLLLFDALVEPNVNMGFGDFGLAASSDTVPVVAVAVVVVAVVAIILDSLSSYFFRQ